MGTYILRRLLQVVPVLVGITVVVFILLHLVPGDPALLVAGQDADMETIERVRADLGLDRPLYVQFGHFVGNALQGDLGTSIRTGLPVTEEIRARYRYTVILALTGTTLATIMGILLGVIAAINQYSLLDNASIVVALLGVSTPSFWFGLMLMLVFALELGWLPAMGASSPKHYILPTITLGAQSAGMIARMTRSSMLEVIRQDYVRTARSKGLREHIVIYRHALKNALIPIVTVIGLRFGGLLAGTVLVESVFNIPGIGRMMVDSVAARDYPMVQGAVLVVATSFVVINLLVDVSYALVDPRIRYG